MQTIVTNKAGLKGVINAIDRGIKEWEQEQKIKELQAKIDTVHGILTEWNKHTEGRYNNILYYLKP